MAEPAQAQLILVLTIGTAGLLTLSAFIVLYFFFYQRRMLIVQRERQEKEIEFERRMLQSQLESQEKERMRIASELHDSLGSLLWAAKVNATLIEKSQNAFSDEVKESHRELLTILDQSIQSVRRISWELSPEAFEHAGLSGSIKMLCQRFDGKIASVKFEENENYFWGDERALHTFRIVQELVTNSLKHSQCSLISVNLKWTTSWLVLVVEDDGIGMVDPNNPGGLGWWSIRQRSRYLKAKVIIGQSPKNKGVSVSIEIPLIHEG